jgi:hypothetical protein
LKKPDAKQDEKDALTKIMIKGRALKVFKGLFYSGSQTDSVGDTPWKQLFYAMGVMEFEVEVEKLHGQSSF